MSNRTDMSSSYFSDCVSSDDSTSIVEAHLLSLLLLLLLLTRYETETSNTTYDDALLCSIDGNCVYDGDGFQTFRDGAPSRARLLWYIPRQAHMVAIDDPAFFYF